MIKNSIVWIRDDFRLQDNPALSFATNNHEFVSAIYIYDKKEFDNIREAQKWWISRSLKSLNEDLVKNNINLEIRTISTPTGFLPAVVATKRERAPAARKRATPLRPCLDSGGKCVRGPPGFCQ